MGKKVEYLLVDGYNIIFAWEELTAIAQTSLEDARKKLMDILCDYQGYKKIEVILVFDAHSVENGIGSSFTYNNIKVVFTKQAQTADNYIELFARKYAKISKVQVATSDNLEQVIILGGGASRISARELLFEVQSAKKEIKEKYLDKKPVKKNALTENLNQETIELLERMRRGDF